MPIVTRSSKGALELIAERMASLESKQLKVGWFKDAKYEDGTPVAGVAAINEYGPHARPFMRPTADREISNWIDLVARGAAQVVKGNETLDNVLEVTAIQIQEDIKETISQVTSPPLSPITLMARKYREEGKKVTGGTIGEIARLIREGKGRFSSNVKPLIESKLMIRTVDHQVEDNA